MKTPDSANSVFHSISATGLKARLQFGIKETLIKSPAVAYLMVEVV